MLNAKNGEIHGIAFRGNNAVFAHYAVLLASGNNLAGQQDQRMLGVIHQHQAVHFRPNVRTYWRRAAAHGGMQISDLSYHDLAGANAFVKRDELAGVMHLGGNHGKNRQIAVRDRL